MKRLLILLAFFVVKLNAQDTIRFKNGITKAVKVSEIGLTEVRYNDFSNPTGPIYVVNKNDISSIRYSNGVEDKFNNVAPSTSTNPAPVATKSLNDRIDIKRGDLFYNGKRVGEVRLQKLVNNCPDAEKQNRMVPVMQEMKN